jgi:thioesterase domain-containing protein
VYLHLARSMPGDLAVFGITPHNIPGAPLAETRIEDMAGFYVSEMRIKQPRGPYLLGGLCAGGVISYEMALQLLHAGETVEVVALLDAATPQALKRRDQPFGRLKRAIAKE